MWDKKANLHQLTCPNTSPTDSEASTGVSETLTEDDKTGQVSELGPGTNEIKCRTTQLEGYWSTMLHVGAKMDRFDNTSMDASRIILDVLGYEARASSSKDDMRRLEELKSDFDIMVSDLRIVQAEIDRVKKCGNRLMLEALEIRRAHLDKEIQSTYSIAAALVLMLATHTAKMIGEAVRTD